MADAAVALQALSDSRSAVQAFLRDAESQGVALTQVIRAVELQVETEIRQRVQERTAAEDALRTCQAQEDARCEAEAARFRRACERLERAQAARARLIDAVGRFAPAKLRYFDAVRSTVPEAVEFLSARARAIEDYAQRGAGGVEQSPPPVAAAAGGEARAPLATGRSGVPEGCDLVSLDLIDDSDSAVSGPGDFGKGYSPEDLRWAYGALDEVVLPALRRGLGADYFRDRDLREGRQGTRSYADTYSGFFGDSAIKLDLGPNGRYTVTNGYHRIWVARQIGRSHVPARC